MRQRRPQRIVTRLAAVMLFTIALVAMQSCRTQSSVVTTVTPSVPQQPATKAIPMILDADFGSSTDDLFALMMLNHYIDEGKVDLRGIIVDREGEKNAGIVDIFNTYYGHPDIPVALERNGVKNPRCFIPYNGIYDLKDVSGQPLFKRSLDLSRLPEGFKLYRQLLSQADDHSVVVVAIGFATTLAQLFESGADEYSALNGAELFGQKVKAVYIQSGRFESGDSLCGYNMRAASKQSEVFYSRLPRNVELIMSPSNIGDGMNYLPEDVMSDLSSAELNPIKAVYSHYHCDTGQRMWDTNCLVNAVEGDESYNLSPRGFVTFVERGQHSLMLFREDPQGNARYQIPGDTYYFAEKLMDIRRYTRMNPHPAAYTIEAPQQQLTGTAALKWAKPRLQLLMDKYLGSAGGKLDPDDVLMLFRPLGYNYTNPQDYAAAEQLVENALYQEMLQRAVSQGQKEMIIITGAPASGKTTALQKLGLKAKGVVYDASLSAPGRLQEVIAQAQAAGMEKVTLYMVYNDVLTCYENATNRGKSTYRFVGLPEMITAFRMNAGRLADVRQQFPMVDIVPIDMSGNRFPQRVSLEEAMRWDFSVTDSELLGLLNYLKEQTDEGQIAAPQLKQACGELLTIPGLSGESLKTAHSIDAALRQRLEAFAIDRQ